MDLVADDECDHLTDAERRALHEALPVLEIGGGEASPASVGNSRRAMPARVTVGFFRTEPGRDKLLLQVVKNHLLQRRLEKQMNPEPQPSL